MDWLRQCAGWLAHLDADSYPPAVKLRPAADWPDRAIVAVDLARVAAVIGRIAADVDELARAAAGAHRPQANPAFIVPEMLHAEYMPATWVPKFAGYLSLGLWTATAFSPTDISAIKPWARQLMITEAALCLGIAALVIARAITIVVC